MSQLYINCLICLFSHTWQSAPNKIEIKTNGNFNTFILCFTSNLGSFLTSVKSSSFLKYA